MWIFLCAAQLQLQRGHQVVGHGLEEAEENAIEYGVDAAVEDEEAEAFRRSDGLENSVLQAQLRELTHRLDSLSEIIYFIGINGGGGGRDDNGLCWEMDQVDCIQMTESLLNNPLSSIALSSFS
ncbi:hypothetical protein LINPERPRIM_LOCUS6898 [Linum perenne]